MGQEAHIKTQISKINQKIIGNIGAMLREIRLPKVFQSRQKRGVHPPLNEISSAAVIEPIIGHTKNEGLLRRNYLKGRKGDEINAIFAAIGFNFGTVAS